MNLCISHWVFDSIKRLGFLPSSGIQDWSLVISSLSDLRHPLLRLLQEILDFIVTGETQKVENLPIPENRVFCQFVQHLLDRLKCGIMHLRVFLVKRHVNDWVQRLIIIHQKGLLLDILLNIFELLLRPLDCILEAFRFDHELEDVIPVQVPLKNCFHGEKIFIIINRVARVYVDPVACDNAPAMGL